MQLHVREIGSWGPGTVRAEWVPSSRPVIDAVERMIDAAWDQASRRPGVILFDGPLCRLESARATADVLHLSVSRTSYKTFLGTNLSHPELVERYGAGVLANPIGLSAALITADDRLMLGRRGPRPAYFPNRVHPFAGALEPQDPLDVFAEMQRELREELLLSPADLGTMRCIGLIEDASLRQPELVFHVQSTLPHETLAAAVDSTEHEGTVALQVTESSLRDAIRDPSYTPIAIGTIALFGRERFGQEWFEQAFRAPPVPFPGTPGEG